MDLVLLACSNRKQSGGVPDYTPSKPLDQALSPESFEKLMYARAELVRSTNKRLPIGPDVGIPGIQAPVEYLPAYQRYTGIVYERGRVQDLYSGQSLIRLVIISALYGLLDGDDLIQKYDLTMDDKISGQCANTWWKCHSLGKIVEEYIQFYNPGSVHDLLPLKYRKALSPWPPPSLYDLVIPYSYPSEGMREALNRRGEDVERLLLS